MPRLKLGREYETVICFLDMEKSTEKAQMLTEKKERWMDRYVAELEERIKKTAFPEMWMDKPIVVCHLIDALKELGKKIEVAVSPQIWMDNRQFIESLVEFFWKKVEKRGIGNLPNAHLSDILIAIYFVYYRDISKDALKAVGSHLKGCKTCFSKVNKLYEKSLWGDLEQIKNTVDEIIQAAEKTAKEEGKQDVWKSIQELQRTVAKGG